MAFVRRCGLAVLLATGLSCATTDPPVFSKASGPVYYTQANIRFVNPLNIPSTNYLRGHLLPVGTPVRILDRGMRDIRFVDASNREFRLIHVLKHTAGTPDDLFRRLFSREDPWAPGGPLDRMSPDIVEHIEQGTVVGGMTREAVLMAYGYPPTHRTRTLESDVWTYWVGRRTTRLVFRQNRLFQADETVLPHTIRFFAVSDPPGAMIEMDGRFLGRAPCMTSVTVDPSDSQGAWTFRAMPARPETPRFGVLASAPMSGAAQGETIVVRNVLPLSTAHRMGVRPGDRLLSINGAQVRNESECADLIASAGFNAPLTVVIERNGKEISLTGRTETPEDGVFHAREETLATDRLLDMHDRILFFDLKSQPALPEETAPPPAPAPEPAAVAPTDSAPDPAPAPAPARFVSALGTGVVIAPNGYVATSAALLKDRAGATVLTASGEEFPAEVIRADLRNDVGLLRVPGLAAPAVPFGRDSRLRKGLRIVCAGFAVDPVTGKTDRAVRAHEGTLLDLAGLSQDARHMQLALPIGGGYSGSPVFDEAGAWIGLVSDSVNGIIHVVAPPGAVLPGTKFVLKASLFESALPAPVRELAVRAKDNAPALSPKQIRERAADSVVMIRLAEPGP